MPNLVFYCLALVIVGLLLFSLTPIRLPEPGQRLLQVDKEGWTQIDARQIDLR
jgi:hypothetical protein